MKLTIWAPKFKDLPTIQIDLPHEMSRQDFQVLYGYTQPSKPYDKTLFLHLIVASSCTKKDLRHLAGELKARVQKAWNRSVYEIVKVEEECRSSQCFVYFQLKRKEGPQVSASRLSTPLKDVSLPKETPPSPKKNRTKHAKHSKIKKKKRRR